VLPDFREVPAGHQPGFTEPTGAFTLPVLGVETSFVLSVVPDVPLVPVVPVVPVAPAPVPLVPALPEPLTPPVPPPPVPLVPLPLAPAPDAPPDAPPEAPPDAPPDALPEPLCATANVGPRTRMPTVKRESGVFHITRSRSSYSPTVSLEGSKSCAAGSNRGV
jgi:hypothetical protein